MEIREQYLGINFQICEKDDGSCAWKLEPRESFGRPAKASGIVEGGQEQGIFAARKAISAYVNPTSPGVGRLPARAVTAR